VLIGDRDTPGNRQASELMGRQIPGAVLKVIPGADHAIPLGWAADLNREVLALIARARRQRRSYRTITVAESSPVMPLMVARPVIVQVPAVRDLTE
jgi:hypothetical protein